MAIQSRDHGPLGEIGTVLAFVGHPPVLFLSNSEGSLGALEGTLGGLLEIS